MQSEMANFAHGAGTWCTRQTIRLVFDSGPFAPLCENMTSSTKLELHNILHCCHKRSKPQPQITCTENFVKFGHVVFTT